MKQVKEEEQGKEILEEKEKAVDHGGRSSHCITCFLLLFHPLLRAALSAYTVGRDREVTNIQKMDKDLRQNEQTITLFHSNIRAT